MGIKHETHLIMKKIFVAEVVKIGSLTLKIDVKRFVMPVYLCDDESAKEPIAFDLEFRSIFASHHA